MEYDRQNHTALLPTLEAYFESGTSGDAAASLFVHRNTVTYRLRAVKRVTGLDVRDPDQRLLLEVQIRLARIRGLLPTGPQRVPRRSRRGRRQTAQWIDCLEPVAPAMGHRVHAVFG